MQITEQIIERIARRTFNSMFAPALRQSNVVTAGAGLSVSWADNAGHADSADSAPWTGITDKPDTATRWPKWSEVTEKPNFATVATSGSYSDLSDKPYIPSVSASVANSTLTVTIDGSSYSLTDTWRPVVDNLTSTNTDKSLSANQGKVLKGYIDTLNGYFDANGNAKSALKLTTVSKTAWGKTFWTAGGIPASIDGDMTSVGDISFSDTGKNIGGFLYFDTANDRIGVGVDTPLSPLHVGGAARFAGDVVPADDYTTTEYTLGLSEKRWSTVYANYVKLSGTAPAIHCENTNGKVALLAATDRGVYDITGDKWLIACNASNTFLMKGNVGIGTTSPGTEKLKVNGSIYTTVGLFSEGYLDTLSDKRFKDVVDYDATPSLDAIADAPAIHFKWNDREDNTMHVGSISQYWQKVMPEATHMRNGKLGMNYDVIATLNTIALAREVRKLKAEIAKLRGHVG